MIFLNETPKPPLDTYIQGIVFHKGYKTDFDKERFLPDCTTNLVINFKDEPLFIFDNTTLKRKQRCEQSWYSGMHTRYITISGGNDSEMMVITFKPGFSFPFVNKSMQEYLNKVVPATEVFGQAVTKLRNELKEIEEPQAKLEFAQEWLLGMRTDVSFSETVIQQLVTEIRNAPDLVNLNRVAIRSGYSHKQFIYLFKKYVGLTPKQFHRMVRFNEILSAIHNKLEVNWIKIAV